MLVDDIRELAHHACGQEKNRFGPAFFDQHVAVVADTAVALARRLGADPEAVALAAWLHDISAICNPATLPTHAADSAQLAVPLLIEQGCPPARAELAGRAIASHSAPIALGAAEPEAVCLAAADALSRPLRPAYWLWFAFTIRQLPFAEGRDWLRTLIESQWAALPAEARALAPGRYEAAMELLSPAPLTVEPGKRSGQPCIRGLRITAGDVLNWLANGMTEQEILADYPELMPGDFRVVYAYAAGLQPFPGS